MRSFWVVDANAEFLHFDAKFIRTMDPKLSFEVVAVFSYDFLGRFRSFTFILAISNRTDLYFNDPVFRGRRRSFWVVCFAFYMVVHGRKKFVWKLKDPLRSKMIQQIGAKNYHNATFCDEELRSGIVMEEAMKSKPGCKVKY